MIRSIYYTPDGTLQENLASDEIRKLLASGVGMLWLDIRQQPKLETEKLLREVFQFHPLAIEDTVHEAHTPKVNDWENCISLVLHTITDVGDGDGKFNIHELDAFLGANYLLTYQTEPVEAVDEVWHRLRQDPRLMEKGAVHLLYRLADKIVDDFLLSVEDIDQAIDRLEDIIFDQPTSETLERIFEQKRYAQQVRRIILPQREVFNKLARGDYDLIAPKDRIYFRDLYDHLVRLHEIIESLRDMSAGALDTYLSLVNNRMNEVMKTLTIFTALFMPLSFLAGFFGMNFFRPGVPLPLFTGKAAFIIMLSAMLITPIGMFLWMRRKTWL